MILKNKKYLPRHGGPKNINFSILKQNFVAIRTLNINRTEIKREINQNYAKSHLTELPKFLVFFFFNIRKQKKKHVFYRFKSTHCNELAGQQS